uniref:Uncharacterized protein n=1 Tax=Setaria viridis TaxID=4556 RepID=A0A4U6VL57_SETVI|nr:hypothetical protein SEVIR_3G416566v2 [Setaria viridis]
MVELARLGRSLLQAFLLPLSVSNALLVRQSAPRFCGGIDRHGCGISVTAGLQELGQAADI